MLTIESITADPSNKIPPPVSIYQTAWDNILAVCKSDTTYARMSVPNKCTHLEHVLLYIQHLQRNQK